MRRCLTIIGDSEVELAELQFGDPNGTERSGAFNQPLPLYESLAGCEEAYVGTLVSY
jgi:hypothetical protein